MLFLSAYKYNHFPFQKEKLFEKITPLLCENNEQTAKNLTYSKNPDGTYRDVVYGQEFKVKRGHLKGAVAPMRSYILMKK